MNRAPNIYLRPLSERDGPALAGLTFSVDDAGVIRYTANYQVDAVRAVEAVNGHADGVVACLGDGGRLVGLELVRYGRCWFEGQERPFALMGNLIVHPDHRRRGIGTRVTHALLERANQQLDEETKKDPSGAVGVIMTNYQAGNPIVKRMLSRLDVSIAGPMRYRPLPTRAKPPDPVEGISAGPLDMEELEPFVYGLNAFYGGYNFHRIETPESLRDLLERDVLPAQGSRPGGPIRHAYAAFDRDGRQVAGLVAFEQYRVRQLEIRGLPGVLKFVNALVPLIPADGTMKEVFLDHVWYRAGHLAAAQHLLEMVRWIWHGKANNVSCFFDPRSPLGKLFPIHVWDIAARTNIAALARPGLPRMDPERLICPVY